MRLAKAAVAAVCAVCLHAQQQPNAPPGAAGKAPPGSAGQTPGAAGPVNPAAAGPASPGAAQMPTGVTLPSQTLPGQTIALDLTGALQRAREFSQQFLTAGIAAQLAREDRVQARAALLPTLNLFNQYIYTQGNGTPSGVFVANDGVHIYNEQGVVHAELFSITKRADYQRAVAAEAAARARQDIAARGLVATLIQNYYTLVTAQRHEANARRSLDEARTFLDITRKLEAGGEAARADVVRAQLQYQQRERDLLDAVTAAQRARMGLGVMLFSDTAQPFTVSDDLALGMPLPALEEVRSLSVTANPDVRAAQASLRQAEAGITSARGAYYPSLVLDYFYGINANVLAFRGPENRQNLGSVVQATVSVPLWNWGGTRSKVRQAELQRQQAQLELTFAQRTLQFNLNAFYLEAQAASAQLDSLRSSLDLSNESLRLTTLRYQAGEATALEVVDAQTTLAAARNAYDDGLARYRAALANIQILTGRF